MIKQFFGVPEENYTIISVKNELSKEDYYDISWIINTVLFWNEKAVALIIKMRFCVQASMHRTHFCIPLNNYK